MNEKNQLTEPEQTIPVSQGVRMVVAFVGGVILLMGGIALFFVFFLGNRGGDGEYTGPLTRGEFVRRVIAVLETPVVTDAIFTDVPLDDPANPYVTAAVRRGVLRPLEIGLVLNADAVIPPAEAIELVTRAISAGAAGEAVLRTHLTGAWFGSETTREQADMLLAAMENTLAAFSAEQTAFRYVEYHTHVIVIENPPFYSFTLDEYLFTIIVYLADDKIRALSPGDTFVFEPSTENPGGISGHVEEVYHVVGGAVITARKPRVLSEIFIQYENNIVFDLWEGYERVTFANQSFPGGVRLDGEIIVYSPRVYASLGLTHVDYLITEAQGRFDNLIITAEAPDTDEEEEITDTAVFIELFTTESAFAGVWVEFLAGLHITRDGAFTLEITADIRTQHGIRDGGVCALSYVGYAFEYAHHYTRAGAALGLETRMRVLGIPIYGIHGAFGRGFTATDDLQAQCHAGACFVVGLFDIRTVHSLTGWGALRNSAALRFAENLAYDGLYDARYIYRGTHRRFSPHPENFEVVEEYEGG